MASVNYAGFYKDFDTDIANTFKYVGVVANSDSQILFVATDDEPRTSGGIHVGRVVDHTIQYADTHARSQILYPHLDNMQALTIKERTAGNDVFYIKDNGDTSISGTLTVSTDVGKTLTVSGGNLQSGGYGEFEGLVSNGNIDVRKGGQIVYRDSGGNRDFMIQNDPSNVLKFQRDTGTGEHTIMAMKKDNGNVGIGNINPTEKLDVDGNIKASGDIKASGGYIETKGAFPTNIVGAPYKMDAVGVAMGRYSTDHSGIELCYNETGGEGIIDFAYNTGSGDNNYQHRIVSGSAGFRFHGTDFDTGSTPTLALVGQNVGINQATATEALEVNGNIKASGTVTSAGLNVRRHTTGNDVFFIKDNGDTSISGTLTVSTDVGKTLTVSGGNLQSGGYGEFEGLVSNGNIDVRKGGQIVFVDDQLITDFMIQNIPSDILGFQRRTDEGDTTIMAMKKDNGNVGIGTTNPSEKLEVTGNIKLSGSLKFNDGDNGSIKRVGHEMRYDAHIEGHKFYVLDDGIQRENLWVCRGFVQVKGVLQVDNGLEVRGGNTSVVNVLNVYSQSNSVEGGEIRLFNNNASTTEFWAIDNDANGTFRVYGVSPGAADYTPLHFYRNGTVVIQSLPHNPPLYYSSITLTPGVAHIDADLHYFRSAAGGNYMFIDSVGNVGINEPIPGEKLQVNGNIKCQGILKIPVYGSQTIHTTLQQNILKFYDYTNSGNYVSIRHTSYGNIKYNGTSHAFELQANNGATVKHTLEIYAAPYGPGLRFSNADDGLVGIGSIRRNGNDMIYNAPANGHIFNVYDDAVESKFSRQLWVCHGFVQVQGELQVDNGLKVRNGGYTTLSGGLEVAGNTTLNGGLGVAGYTTISNLTVDGTALFKPTHIESGTDAGGIQFKAYAKSFFSSYYLRTAMVPEKNGGAYIGQADKQFYEIHAITVKASGITLTSDDRLKHNEEDITDALETINKLKLQKYDKTHVMMDADFNGDLTGFESIKEAGFIAQEVAEIPELAFLVGGGGSRETIDKEAVVNEETGDEVTPATYKTIELPYNLNYIGLSNYAIQAIQELDSKYKAKISSLEDTILSLVSRLEALEN